MDHKHILVTTDLSPACLAVTNAALKLAKCFDARLSLLHVVEHVPMYADVFTGPEEYQQALTDAAQIGFEQLADNMGIKAEDRYLEIGSAKGKILDVAERLGVDLIVVGSHGRHGIAKILGSTASGVLHGADCDVLTIRYDDE